jgi:hypothetical protein
MESDRSEDIKWNVEGGETHRIEVQKNLVSGVEKRDEESFAVAHKKHILLR